MIYMPLVLAGQILEGDCPLIFGRGDGLIDKPPRRLAIFGFVKSLPDRCEAVGGVAGDKDGHQGETEGLGWGFGDPLEPGKQGELQDTQCRCDDKEELPPETFLKNRGYFLVRRGGRG